MQLSVEEQQQFENLLKDEQSSGMILWTETQADGNSHANGFVQGDQIEIVMMTIHAVNFAAEALGMKPDQLLEKLATFISETNPKPSKIKTEPCDF